jgi:ribose transport system ATP-binding protein
VGTLTVAENVALTRGFARRARLIDWRGVQQRAREALSTIGVEIDVQAEVEDLSRAEQSLVAIARAVASDCRALVLDEPTASLPAADVARLFNAIERLRSQGVAVLYVTHRLDEVFEIADRVVVLRDGRLVADEPVSTMTPSGLVELIVGTTAPAHERGEPDRSGTTVVRLSNVRLGDGPATVSLDIRAGEIIGLAGLRGAGQELLGRGIAGVERLVVEFGELHGRRLHGGDLRRALAEHTGFASSHREREGLAMTLTVRENLFMNPGADGSGFASWLSPRRERAKAIGLGESVALRPNLPDVVVGTLSGGNQQKVVLARWLFLSPDLLVLEEPTMGIDVGARAEIYGLLRRAASEGLAVVVVSSDFEELAQVCQRVIVLDRGRAAGELYGDDITVSRVTDLATAGAGHETVSVA